MSPYRFLWYCYKYIRPFPISRSRGAAGQHEATKHPVKVMTRHLHSLDLCMRGQRFTTMQWLTFIRDNDSEKLWADLKKRVTLFAVSERNHFSGFLTQDVERLPLRSLGKWVPDKLDLLHNSNHWKLIRNAFFNVTIHGARYTKNRKIGDKNLAIEVTP